MGLLRLGLGAFHNTDTTRFGFGLDLLRLGKTGGAISSVLRLLGDQLLLAACAFGFVAELILRNRALLVDRQRAAFDHCLVRFLLELLARCRLQCLFEIAGFGSASWREGVGQYVLMS